MGFREQVTKPNPVGKWLRNYRRENDLSVVELQVIFDKEGTLGVPIRRVETTDSPMTKVVSEPIIEYFEYNPDLVDAFKEHNHTALGETHEL